MLKHDLKRIFFSYGFYVAVVIFVFLGIMQQIQSTKASSDYLMRVYGIENYGFLNRYFFSTCGDSSTGVMKQLLPILCGIPCANLYLEEYKSRYLRNVLLRTSKIKYFFSKILTAIISGMAVILAGELILALITLFIDASPSKAIIQTGSFLEENLYKKLYLNNMPLFAVFESFNLMLFGGAYSLMTLGFSAMWNNKYLTYSTGFLFANIVIAELNQYLVTPWPTSTIAPWDLELIGNTYADVLIQFGAIALISTLVFGIFFVWRSKTDV